MIAQVDDNVRRISAQIGLHGFERPEVSVNIGDDCDSHVIIIKPTSSRSRRYRTATVRESVLLESVLWGSAHGYSPPIMSSPRSLVRFSNLVNSRRNTRFTLPVGPLRCFATSNSAMPRRSSRSGL